VRAQRRTPRAPARAKQLSRMPGNSSSPPDFARIRSRSANEMEAHESRQDRRLLSRKSRLVPGAQTKPHKKDLICPNRAFRIGR